MVRPSANVIGHTKVRASINVLAQDLFQALTNVFNFRRADGQRRGDTDGVPVAIVSQQVHIQKLATIAHGVAVSNLNADEQTTSTHFLDFR